MSLPLWALSPHLHGQALGLDQEFESLWAAFEIQIPSPGPSLTPNLCLLCSLEGAIDVKTPSSLFPLFPPPPVMVPCL